MDENTVKNQNHLELGADTEKHKRALPIDNKTKKSKKAKKLLIEQKDEETEQKSRNSDKKSPTLLNSNATDSGLSDENTTTNSKENTNNVDADAVDEVKKEFPIESTNQTFKLRLVPLERLLSSAKKAELNKEKSSVKDTQSKTQTVVRKLLPERTNRKNYSVIEISSSDNTDEDDLVIPSKSRQSVTKITAIKATTIGASTTLNNIKNNQIKSTPPKVVETTSKKIENQNPCKRNKEKAEKEEEENNNPKTRLRRCVVRLKRTPWPEYQRKQKEQQQKKQLLPQQTEKQQQKDKQKEKEEKEKEKENQQQPKKRQKKEEKGKEKEKEKEKEEKLVLASEEATTAIVTEPEADNLIEKNSVTEKTNKQTTTSRLKRLPSSTESSVKTKSDNTEKTKDQIEKSEMEKPSSTKRRKHSTDDDSDFELVNPQPDSDADTKQDDQSDNDNENYDNDNDNDEEDDDDDVKSSDSEVLPTRKKRVFSKKKSDSDDSDFEPKSKKSQKSKKPKRRRIKNDSDDDDDDDDDDGDGKAKKHKRKDIRKIIRSKDLDVSTKEAAKEEDDRRKRIEERQKVYNKIYDLKQTEEIKELILDFDDETKEPLLQVDAGILKKLKPHQVAGVKFMWDACFETLAECTENPGSGCILAHCMGLGKTLQVVTLSHTLLSNARKTHVERVLIISPLSTLNNWAREFKQWMSFARKKNIEIYDMSRFRDKNMRIFKLYEWFEEGGVCILGYDMYRILANEKAKGLRKKQREQLQQALVDPGPDLVICDEGHLLKNEKTSISKAVTRMRTKRRIVLTGTPLQNNLKEYYCMIQFIKPNLLGTYKEYLNRFVNPITNGQYTDSTVHDIRLMKHRSHILHTLLEGCIQRRDYSVLAPYLPPKHEYVVYTTLSDLQQKIYSYYMTTQRDIISSDIYGKGARLFQNFQDLRRIWTHPMSLRVNSDIVIRKRLLADDENSLEDFICDDEDDEDGNGNGAGTGRGHNDETTTDESSVDSAKSFASGGGAGGAAGSSKTRRTRANKNANGNHDDDEEDEELSQNVMKDDDPSEWWKRFVNESDLNNVYHSPKLVILMQLLQQCEAIGDKLLVFSQSLQSLDVIEHFLSIIDNKTNGYEYEGEIGNFKGSWKLGADYFRLDGSSSVDNREDMCKRFNDSKNLRARLFLISTRAGGLGINLVAANRVVIFDVSWNPSHDTQSIFRVYRFGQDKPCYIYRLIAMGTMEQKVYERQVTKQATAKRVIDEQQISRHYNQSDLQELYSYELQPLVPREIPILPKDRLFAELLSEREAMIFKYHEHDSLLENEESENLNEEDRKAAWSEYEAEKTRATQTQQYISYDRTAYANPTGGNVTSNRIFGFRSDVILQLLNMKVSKDHPEFTQTQILQLVPDYLNRLYNEMNNGDPTMYKELLVLHSTLTHPSGMYMSPLLYANQNPQAAGYYQAPGAQPPTQNAGQPPAAAAVVDGAAGVRPTAPGFDANEVYEID